MMQHQLFSFLTQTNLLKANFTFTISYYHDQVTNLLYFLQPTNNGCKLVHINLEEGALETDYALKLAAPCYDKIDNFTISSTSFVQLALVHFEGIKTSYTLISQDLGEVHFTSPYHN